jgi:predicted RNase H-like nuclease (RuvC/YqgF family)
MIKDKDEKWYLRPHHLESLTDHPSSLKDNVIDSNYYTFYSELERDFRTGEYIRPEITAERKKPTDTEKMIEGLESHISNLKNELNRMANGQIPRYDQGKSIPVNPMQI